MIGTVSVAAGLLALLAVSCHAAPTVIHSRQDPGVTLSFEQVPSKICETVPGVKSFSGYITLPPDGAFQPYEASLFFWFFESRILPDKAPLTLWLQGGPGMASVTQAVSGHNGPCRVKHDSNSTEINLYSWNDVSNMLYLDQPAQTGFSYDVPTPGYRDMITGDVFPGASGPGNVTYRPGKFGSQDMSKTANTTGIAARAVTNFLDLWGQQNPAYKRKSINIWTQSYGGHYAPALAVMLQKAGKITVDSVGIISGVLDLIIQGIYYPDFAVNNTYGIKAYDDTVAASAVNSFYTPGGCHDQVLACTALQQKYDPNNYANNASVNSACLDAQNRCLGLVYAPYEIYSGRNPFDIGHTLPDPFPPPFATGYLNNAWVQAALGARVNFTDTSPVTNHAFFGSADYMRGYTAELAHLLDQGVRVALVHGDRDFRCNWFGGEAVSLRIPWSGSGAFAGAGYASLTVPLSAPGGFVRQLGGLSFSRVFQAGHEVPYYQPAAALAIYTRTLLGLDVATGLTPVGKNSGYSTTGPKDVRNVSTGPPSPAKGPVECYIDAAPLNNSPVRCTDAQLAALEAGTAVVNKDRIVVSPAP